MLVYLTAFLRLLGWLCLAVVAVSMIAAAAGRWSE